MKLNRRRFLGSLFATGAVVTAAPVLLKGNERIVPLSEARNLTNVVTRIRTNGKVIDVTPGPGMSICQTLDEGNSADFVIPQGTLKLGDRIRIRVSKMDVVFEGNVQRIEMEFPTLTCRVHANDDLDRMAAASDLKMHIHVDPKGLSDVISKEFAKSLKSRSLV